jgi:hypothetical protein
MGLADTMSDTPDIVTQGTASGLTPLASSDSARIMSAVNPQHGIAPPFDTTVAQARVVAYLHALGVTDPAARQVAQTLDSRIDPNTQDAADPAMRAEAMLEALDRWCDALPEALGLQRDAARVAFALSRKLGGWLSDKPEALDDPTVLVSELTRYLDHWPQGVLPALPHQRMHRQPLGDLPAVLRGAFWSGTYRWVLPSANRNVGPTSAVKDKT